MSQFIDAKQVDQAVGSLRKASGEAESAAKQLNAAAAAVASAQAALQSAQTSSSQPSYNAGSGYNATPVDNQYQLQSFQNRLSEAREREQAAAGHHQQAMTTLGSAQQSAQELLRKVTEHIRDAQDDASKIRQQSGQLKGATSRIKSKEQQQGVQKDLSLLEKFRKQLESALSRAKGAGAQAQRSSGGGLEQRIGSIGGFSSGKRFSSYSFNPRQVYSTSNYASLDTQLASNPYRSKDSKPDYNTTYQSVFRGLGRYF